MTEPLTLSGSSEQDIIDLVTLTRLDNPFFLHAILIHDYNEVELIIDKDSGTVYHQCLESITLRSLIDVNSHFTFTVKNRTIFDIILGAFGRKTVKTGYKLLDRGLTFITNDKLTLLETLSDPCVLELLSKLKDFTFSLSVNKSPTNNGLTLELDVFDTAGDDDFKPIYRAFNTVLKNIQHRHAFFTGA